MKYNDAAMEQRVLQKAAQLMEKRGIRGWNMDQLAEETNLAKNTLYRIINSKEELMEQIVLRHCKRIYAILHQILQGNDSYMDTLEKLICAYSELLPAFFSEIFMEYPRIEEAVERQNTEIRQQVLGYIEQGIHDGYLRKELHAEQVFDLLRAVGLFYSELGKEERAGKMQFAFQCVLHGIVQK